jgi:hypothetical protein
MIYSTAHEIAATVEDWPLLIETLDEVLAEMAPLKGFFSGGMNAVAEHERARVLAVIRERLRKEWTDRKPPTEGVLDAMSRADPEYEALLIQHRDGRTELAFLERRATILEHKIARLRALHFAASRLAQAGV